jgi:hypothetical protein
MTTIAEFVFNSSFRSSSSHTLCLRHIPVCRNAKNSTPFDTRHGHIVLAGRTVDTVDLIHIVLECKLYRYLCSCLPTAATRIF